MVIALHQALCKRYGKDSGVNYAYKPNDNYFREKFDLQGVQYTVVGDMLRYELPRFELHPLGQQFLLDHYYVNEAYYNELMEKIFADPWVAYKEVTEVLSHRLTTCSVYDYNLNSSLSF